MEKSAILDVLVEELKNQGHLPEARIEAEEVGAITLDSMDLDSLDLLQFSIDIEERIGVEIDADDIPVAISLADLVDMIVAQRDK